MYIFSNLPRYISGGANWAIANNHDVMLTTVLQKFWLCEIWVAFDLKVNKKKGKNDRAQSYK